MIGDSIDGIERSARLDKILDVFLQDLPEMTGLRICEEAGLKPGTITPQLATLEAHQWVTSGWGPGPEPRRRFYQLTPLGRTRALALLGRYSPPRGDAR